MATSSKPPTDLQYVVDNEIKLVWHLSDRQTVDLPRPIGCREWHFRECSWRPVPWMNLLGGWNRYLFPPKQRWRAFFCFTTAGCRSSPSEGWCFCRRSAVPSEYRSYWTPSSRCVCISKFPAFCGTWVEISNANSPYGILGSYEIWVPAETFASVFSYLSMHRGNLRWVSRRRHSNLLWPFWGRLGLASWSILWRRNKYVSAYFIGSDTSNTSPVRSESVYLIRLYALPSVHLCVCRDHESRAAWLGQPFPLDTSTLPIRSHDIPSQYSSLSQSFIS